MRRFKMMSVLSLLFLFIAHINAKLTSNELEMFTELANSVKVLEQKLSNVENELDRLKEINRNLENRLNAQTTTLSADMAFDKRDAQGNVVSENKNNMRVGRQEREQVAFSAYLKNSLSHLGPGHTIQYGATVLNEGNAFNANTGIFTVPHDGVYLFSYACEDYHNHRIYADILVDGTRKSLVLEGPSTAHNMGTNVVILRLTKGQAVWVAIDAGGQDNILQSVASTFSGVFLYY